MRKYMLALMALLTPALLSAPAYASVGDIVQPGAGNYLPIFAALDDVVDVMGEVWKVMTGNPLLVAYLAAGLIGVGVWIFRKVKRSAKG